MHSQDYTEPAISLRQQKFHIDIDPLKIGVSSRYDFELDVFDILTTRSKALAVVGGNILKEGSEHNDYYGVGTSVREAAKDADAMMQAFPGIDVEVRTSIVRMPAFRDQKKAPFYNQAYRAFLVSETWRVDEDGSRMRAWEREIVSWKSGLFTPEHAEMMVVIEKAVAEDVSTEWRRKT